jgi:hypothetical protein
MPDFFGADDLAHLLQPGHTPQLNENTPEIKENEVDCEVGHGRNVAAGERGKALMIGFRWADRFPNDASTNVHLPFEMFSASVRGRLKGRCLTFD